MFDVLIVANKRRGLLYEKWSWWWYIRHPLRHGSGRSVPSSDWSSCATEPIEFVHHEAEAFCLPLGARLYQFCTAMLIVARGCFFLETVGLRNTTDSSTSLLRIFSSSVVVLLKTIVCEVALAWRTWACWRRLGGNYRRVPLLSITILPTHWMRHHLTDIVQRPFSHWESPA